MASSSPSAQPADSGRTTHGSRTDDAPTRRLEHAGPPSTGTAQDIPQADTDAAAKRPNLALIRARENAELKQAALAKLIPISERQLQRWENENVVPKRRTRERIAELLSTTVEEIFPPEPEPERLAPEPTPGVLDPELERELVDRAQRQWRRPPLPRFPRPRIPAVKLARPSIRAAAITGAAAVVAAGGIAALSDPHHGPTTTARAAATTALNPQQKIDQRINAALARGDYDQALTIAKALDDTSRVAAIKRRAVGVLLTRTDAAIDGHKLKTARDLLGRATGKYGDPIPAKTAKRWARIHGLEAEDRAKARVKAHAAAKRHAQAVRAKRDAAHKAAAQRARATPAPSAAPTPATAAPSTSSPAPSSGSSSSSASPAPSTGSSSSSSGGASKSSGSKPNSEFNYLGG